MQFTDRFPNVFRKHTDFLRIFSYNEATNTGRRKGHDMEIFSAFEKHDCCPYQVHAFKVVNSKSTAFSNFHKVGRDNCALTYVLDGSFIYYYEDKTENPVMCSFECKAGEMTFLPVGSIYHHENLSPASMYVLYFSMSPDISSEFNKSIPIHLKVSDPKRFERLFENTVSYYFSLKRSAMQVKSGLCEILSALAAEEKPNNLSEHELAMLSPALDALSTPGMNGKNVPTVAELARSCCMSEFAFRELFKRYAGMPPKRFIDLRRVELVESLLISEDITVTDAALDCGFTEPSYFFKLYKRLRGRTIGKTR